MNAKIFDNKFDRGDSVLSQLDLSKATCPDQELQQISIDFPLWMIKLLDKEARRLKTSSQSVIRMWIAEKLEARSETTHDPIVAEVRRVRERLLAECGGDLHKYVDRIREAQEQDRDRLVTKEEMQRRKLEAKGK
jgi:hypothetical protein